ncbi:hypothetical protein [Lysinibacillus sp. OL1]|nr:hypothetical protein [Lysinibacillus sp. OL1]
MENKQAFAGIHMERDVLATQKDNLSAENKLKEHINDNKYL